MLWTCSFPNLTPADMGQKMFYAYPSRFYANLRRFTQVSVSVNFRRFHELFTWYFLWGQNYYAFCKSVLEWWWYDGDACYDIYDSGGYLVQKSVRHQLWGIALTLVKPAWLWYSFPKVQIRKKTRIGSPHPENSSQQTRKLCDGHQKFPMNIEEKFLIFWFASYLSLSHRKYFLEQEKGHDR